MATEFKKVSLALSSTSVTNLYRAPANCDTVVIGLLVCNRHSADITVTVDIDVETGVTVGSAANTDINLVKDVIVPTGSSLDLIDGNKIVLVNTSGTDGNGDLLRITSSHADTDVLVSILENT
tara:strand:+ start:50 stop:418 length:369 start_codon:yes stop_codon:yes gene_type:complete